MELLSYISRLIRLLVLVIGCRKYLYNFVYRYVGTIPAIACPMGGLFDLLIRKPVVHRAIVILDVSCST